MKNHSPSISTTLGRFSSAPEPAEDSWWLWWRCGAELDLPRGWCESTAAFRTEGRGGGGEADPTEPAEEAPLLFFALLDNKLCQDQRCHLVFFNTRFHKFGIFGMVWYLKIWLIYLIFGIFS